MKEKHINEIIELGKRISEGKHEDGLTVSKMNTLKAESLQAIIRIRKSILKSRSSTSRK